MIDLQHIHARFGTFTLHDINLRVAPGQYCVLLGPPGSGKTSIVEILCGLRPMLRGKVLIGGRQVQHADPADRQIGYVPQDYALFPTLGVADNIAFGLAVRHRPAREVRQRIDRVAARLNIECLLDRSCRGLSGGERQRVALARALVLEPKVLLLDEPVSALDESTRQRVCLELRHLHDSLGTTTIHISHNFEETRSVADLVAVINHGRLVQAGSVDQIFREPQTEFVARFVQAGNILQGHMEANGPSGWAFNFGGAAIRLAGVAAPGPASMLLRPYDASLESPGEPVAAAARSSTDCARLPGTVVSVNDNGGFQVTARVLVAGEPFTVMMPRQAGCPSPWRAGARANVVFDPARLRPLAPDLSTLEQETP